MRIPTPRGPVSERVTAVLHGTAGTGDLTTRTAYDLLRAVGDPLESDDLQLALWVLYELHYRGFDDAASDDLEWDPQVLGLRAALERPFESALRDLTAPAVRQAADAAPDVVDQLQALMDRVEGRSLATYLQRQATAEQFVEFMTHRSIYHLKESDPHAWVVPRLEGPAKVALAELQYDEFGAGLAENLHQQLFARALEGTGLSPEYGAYVDAVPARTLAVNNAMSLFGLHRRLRAACMGHLAAFEATSSLPCRRYSSGAELLGFGPEVLRYFDEHVEADAVHEHLAMRTICGSLVAADPELRDNVLFGAASCLLLEQRAGEQMMAAWDAGGTSLVAPPREEVA